MSARTRICTYAHAHTHTHTQMKKCHSHQLLSTSYTERKREQPGTSTVKGVTTWLVKRPACCLFPSKVTAKLDRQQEASTKKKLSGEDFFFFFFFFFFLQFGRCWGIRSHGWLRWDNKLSKLYCTNIPLTTYKAADFIPIIHFNRDKSQGVYFNLALWNIITCYCII